MEELNLIERLNGEHFLIYLNRLLKLKENKEIDIDKIEIYELVFGEKLSSSEARKRLYNWRDILLKGQEEGQSAQDIVEAISFLELLLIFGTSDYIGLKDLRPYRPFNPCKVSCSAILFILL